MSRLSSVLRMTEYGPMVWCPACKSGHTFNDAQHPTKPIVIDGKTISPGGASWTWDNNAERPTFTPSMLVGTPQWTDDEGKVHPAFTICHSFVRAGRIEFLGDCAHQMAGQTVDLPAWPEFNDD